MTIETALKIAATNDGFTPTLPSYTAPLTVEESRTLGGGDTLTEIATNVLWVNVGFRVRPGNPYPFTMLVKGGKGKAIPVDLEVKAKEFVPTGNTLKRLRG